MDKRIFLIEKYICENLQKELTIEDLANQTKLSAAHFTKFFKDHFGTSPKHYIKNVRLEEACKLLESEEILQINEIALAVGFKDSAYFIRAFTEKYGIPPKKYESQKWDEKTDEVKNNEEKSLPASEKVL